MAINAIKVEEARQEGIRAEAEVREEAARALAAADETAKKKKKN